MLYALFQVLHTILIFTISRNIDEFWQFLKADILYVWYSHKACSCTLDWDLDSKLANIIEQFYYQNC